MSRNTLPINIDPFHAARRQDRFSGLLLQIQMLRLSPLLASMAEGSDGAGRCVWVDLQFSLDPQRYTLLQGTLRTTLVLPCQRCLQSFELAVNHCLALACVTDDSQAALLPEAYEPLMVVDRKLDVRDWVETEILLQLPLVAKHEQTDCPVQLGTESTPMIMAPLQIHRPFTALEGLQQKQP